MGFSVTGNLLPGSMQRPDIVLHITTKRRPPKGFKSDTDAKMHKLNKLGYIPGVSSITGLGRALLGIVHAIVHLACAIFSKNRGHHLQEAGLGVKNIVRGIVEAIPLIGNITMLIIDTGRTSKYSKMAHNQINQNRQNYMNTVTTFVNGQEIPPGVTIKFYT